MNTTTEKTQLSLSVVYKKAEEAAKDALLKIPFLKDFKTKHGLSVIGNPDSLPLSALQRVCRGINNVDFEKFEDFVEVLLYSAHGYYFVLARNGSNAHKKYEEKQKNTGGILSTEIFDLGEFRIAKTAGDYITAGADFSLFKIKE